MIAKVLVLFLVVESIPSMEIFNVRSSFLASPPTSHNQQHRGSRRNDIKRMSVMLLRSRPELFGDESYVWKRIEKVKIGESDSHNEISDEYVHNDSIDQSMLPNDVLDIGTPRINSRRAKNSHGNDMETEESRTAELEILITTEVPKPPPKTTASKPKKSPTAPKRPPLKVNGSRIKSSHKQDVVTDGEDTIIDEVDEQETGTPDYWYKPQSNNMSGQSQIGNRESQMVIKPTVIINFRGTVSNRDSDIRLEGRNGEDQNITSVPAPLPQNVFNINQEVNIEKTYAILDDYRETAPPQRRNKHPQFEVSEGRSDAELGEPIDLMKVKVDHNKDYDAFVPNDYDLSGSASDDIQLKMGNEEGSSEEFGRKLKIDDKNIVFTLTDFDRNTPYYIFTVGPLGGFLSSA